MSERYTNFKKQLLKKQFSEAKLYPGYFFRATTDQVALIINLTDDEYSVTADCDMNFVSSTKMPP